MSETTWASGPLRVRLLPQVKYQLTYTANLTTPITRTTVFDDGRLETVTVIGTETVEGCSAGFWIDGDAPFGIGVVSLTYQTGKVRVAVGAAKRDRSIISDPISGKGVSVLGHRVADLTYHSATTASWVDVTPGGQPVISARPEQKPTLSFAVYTETRKQREQLNQLLASRQPLLLRSPTKGVDDIYFALIGDRIEKRVLEQHASEEARLHEWRGYVLDRQTVERHSTGETLGDLHAYRPTNLQSIADSWPSFGDVAADPLGGEDD